MNIPGSNIGASTFAREIECRNTLSFPVKVVFYNRDLAAFPEVFMESLSSARVYANAVLELAPYQCSVAEITTTDHAEVMRGDDAWHPDFISFPLADLTRLPRIPHTPSDQLARHFQMAGAVDQACVERLTALWRAGRRKARVERFKVDFLAP